MTSVFVILSFFSALPAAPAVAQQPLDIAPFARVITCDPARRDGARSGRLEEFRAKDVFLTMEVPRRKDGNYIVPVFPDGQGCIGLEWAERRVLTQLSIRFSNPANMPDPATAGVEYWSSAGRKDSWGDIGQTPWQGQWALLPGRIEKQDDRWILHVDKNTVPEFKEAVGVLKIRWILPKGTHVIALKDLAALSDSATAIGEFRAEVDSRVARGPATLDLYNGQFADAAAGVPLYTEFWDPAEPARFKLIYTVPKASKADRTLIRFTLPAGGFSVAVEDLLANECVYVKDYGVLVSRAEVATTLSQYREKIAGRKTILQQVREAPDQTFEAAWKALRRPIQDNGPTMLSLPCDNAKFIVERDGTIRYGKFAVVPTFGARRTRLERLDFGKIGIDTAVVPPNAGKGLPMRIKDTTFKKGLGLHAHAQLSVELNGEDEAFESKVGVQWQDGSDLGTVTFQIDVDGKRVFDSGPIKQKDTPRPVRIPLAGARRMTLIASTGADIHSAAANWADARLIRARSASERQAAVTQPAEEYLSDLYAHDERPRVRTRRMPSSPDHEQCQESETVPSCITSEVKDGQVSYRQDVVVFRSTELREPVCGAGFTLSQKKGGKGLVRLEFYSDFENRQRATLRMTKEAVLVLDKGHVLAYLDPRIRAHQASSMHDGTLLFWHDAQASLCIPGHNIVPDQVLPVDVSLDSIAATLTEWQKWLGSWFGGPGSPKNVLVNLPVPLLDDVIRATQAHILMAARTAPDGKSIEPWIASNTYGPLDTEAQAVILGMDLMGHHDFARRSHEFFISSYNKDGLLAKGYTLMGTGQHLWTLAEHVKLTGDTEWFKKVTPEVLRPCEWIKRQLEKTKRDDAAGVHLPEYGLMPPGVLADWNRYAFYFYANAHYCAGLRGVAECLARINHPRAAEIGKLADEYRERILAAWKWQQARMPVLPLRNGTWVPATPSSLYCYGLTRDFYGGVSATGHDVEVGGNHFIPLGLIDPKSREANWIADYYEDRWFLIDGIFGAYPAPENEADPFNRGGFAKLQPHYARTSDFYALRDDVKPFIRTYFNTFLVLLNTENLTFWEHMNNGGAWNKTHESGWFLQMTRTMLVQERGNELWLAPFVTNNWLKPGKGVTVQNAPTYFGPISYELEPVDNGNAISAVITPPARSAPKTIVLRLRHPEGKRLQQVLVDLKPSTDFDAEREIIRIQPTTGPIHVHAEY